MRLYVKVKTNMKDAVIDFIEIKTPEKTVTLDWDESGITRTEDGFEACYKGVYFNEEYANGRIRELQNGRISAIQVYSEDQTENPSFCFVGNLSFYDDFSDLELKANSDFEIIYE